MSGRAIMRTLSVARTIADMEESHEVLMKHLCEALSFQVRKGWAYESDSCADRGALWA